MTQLDRLGRCSERIDLAFVERERTPEWAIQEGTRLQLMGVSLSNTVVEPEEQGVSRSRTAVHNWVQKDGLQPTSDAVPNPIAVDDPVIRINGERCWLYAAVDSATNELLHVRLFQTRTTQLTLLFLRELREKQQVEQATFLVDGA